MDMAVSTADFGDETEEQQKLYQVRNTSLYKELSSDQIPLVYSPHYQIGFWGLEKLHPFDAGKWGKVFNYLKEAGLASDKNIMEPSEATQEDLLVVHPDNYLSSLKYSFNVARITEVPPVVCLPNFVVQRRVLKPFRYHTGGTIMAAKLALQQQWAINIGGGFHHCCAYRGGGFCAYADITLAIRFLLLRGEIKSAMIVDLDAHQGNGHERDFPEKSVYILDVYNSHIYPQDGAAKRNINRNIELAPYIADHEYLQVVKRNVAGALNEFQPDLLVYNAGTDILDGDPLGCMSISAAGIIQRDEIVFQNAISRSIPIVMTTSGGYQKCTARIIADSILNLRDKNLISC